MLSSLFQTAVQSITATFGPLGGQARTQSYNEPLGMFVGDPLPVQQGTSNQSRRTSEVKDTYQKEFVGPHFKVKIGQHIRRSGSCEYIIDVYPKTNQVAKNKTITARFNEIYAREFERTGDVIESTFLAADIPQESSAAPGNKLKHSESQVSGSDAEWETTDDESEAEAVQVKDSKGKQANKAAR